LSVFNETSGIERIVKAFGYSMQGFRQCFTYEAAFRQEVALSVLLIPLAWWLGETGLEQAVMIASWLMVLVIELINSAIEAAIDRFGDEQHELSGRAKDIGSAAVFLAITIAGLVWALILLPRYL